MTKVKKNSDKSFIVQGSLLAIAGVITKIIGAVYRVPLVNILGDKGMGYYGVAFQIYAIALTLTSYSLPLQYQSLSRQEMLPDSTGMPTKYSRLLLPLLSRQAVGRPFLSFWGLILSLRILWR